MRFDQRWKTTPPIHHHLHQRIWDDFNYIGTGSTLIIFCESADFLGLGVTSRVNAYI